MSRETSQVAENRPDLMDTAIEAEMSSLPTLVFKAPIAQGANIEPSSPVPSGILTIEQSSDKDMAGKTILINQFPFTVGRANCDLELKGAPGVSRQHAQILFQDGRYFVLDLGSTNHTFVDDAVLPVNAPVPLADGAIIRLGSYTVLRFQLNS